MKSKSLAGKNATGYLYIYIYLIIIVLVYMELFEIHFFSNISTATITCHVATMAKPPAGQVQIVATSGSSDMSCG